MPSLGFLNKVVGQPLPHIALTQHTATAPADSEPSPFMAVIYTQPLGQPDQVGAVHLQRADCLCSVVAMRF